MHILEYILINHIQNNGFFGGELEIAVTVDLYNINIFTYREIYKNNNSLIGFSSINNYNHNDNNKERYLMILINRENIYFRLGYNSHKIKDFHYNIMKNNINNLNENNKDEFEKKEINSDTSNIRYLLTNIINQFKDLKNYKFTEVLNLYKDINEKRLSYDDIYFDISYYDKNSNTDKYSVNFKNKNQGINYHERRQPLLKKTKKLLIDNNKRLLKAIIEINSITKTKVIKNLLVAPPKYVKEFINLYHLITGLKWYHNLAAKITIDGYYIKGLYHKISEEISNCVIFKQNKKIYLMPLIIKIMPKGPKYEYQFDIIEIPIKIKPDDNIQYILLIIDGFSIYGDCFLLNNKKAETVLGGIKDFIYKNGKQVILYRDNGKEFFSKLFADYWNTKDMKIIRGIPYHIQSQEIVESFNREIKDYLKINI